ncbi:hypothetical protein [Anaerovorax odorimutans]|uniref:hypothetical protein n=1 Tax=Anaerovorax odorimutans TaxID=109327 RepID=UPI000423B2FC|nr:hypothetical protein [Anaerovorax odorimutans]
MPIIINKEIIKEKQITNDNENIMLDLIIENAELKQKISDMEMIVADILGGNS